LRLASPTAFEVLLWLQSTLLPRGALGGSVWLLWAADVVCLGCGGPALGLVVGCGCSELQQPSPSLFDSACICSSLPSPLESRCDSHYFDSHLSCGGQSCGSGLGGHWRKLCLAYASADNGCASFVTYHVGGVVGTRPGQNTRYPLPVPELPEPEVPDPKFG
jgi:hypothetical protein